MHDTIPEHYFIYLFLCLLIDLLALRKYIDGGTTRGHKVPYKGRPPVVRELNNGIGQTLGVVTARVLLLP